MISHVTCYDRRRNPSFFFKQAGDGEVVSWSGFFYALPVSVHFNNVFQFLLSTVSF